MVRPHLWWPVPKENKVAFQSKQMLIDIPFAMFARFVTQLDDIHIVDNEGRAMLGLLAIVSERHLSVQCYRDIDRYRYVVTMDNLGLAVVDCRSADSKLLVPTKEHRWEISRVYSVSTSTMEYLCDIACQD